MKPTPATILSTLLVIALSFTVLAFWVIFQVLTLEGKDDKDARFLPPTYEGIVSLGCKCTQITIIKDSWWHTHVVIVYKDQTLIRLYSIRLGNERKKALEDCNRWMEYVRKHAPKSKLPREKI